MLITYTGYQSVLSKHFFYMLPVQVLQAARNDLGKITQIKKKKCHSGPTIQHFWNIFSHNAATSKENINRKQCN